MVIGTVRGTKVVSDMVKPKCFGHYLPKNWQKCIKCTLYKECLDESNVPRMPRELE